MENPHAYESIKYLEPQYMLHALQKSPGESDRYGFPIVNHAYAPINTGNEMVAYALSSSRKPPAGESGSGGIDDLFADRIDLIRSKIEMVLLQLKWRREIHDKVLYDIDQDDVRADNLLLEMGPGAYFVGGDRLAVERMKFDLERQKRMEKVGYFKDTAILNKELKESLIEYLGETRKSSFVSELEV